MLVSDRCVKKERTGKEIWGRSELLSLSSEKKFFILGEENIKIGLVKFRVESNFSGLRKKKIFSRDFLKFSVVIGSLIYLINLSFNSPTVVWSSTNTVHLLRGKHSQFKMNECIIFSRFSYTSYSIKGSCERKYYCLTWFFSFVPIVKATKFLRTAPIDRICGITELSIENQPQITSAVRCTDAQRYP